jgi:uncharacterized protein (TIGR03435 family)
MKIAVSLTLSALAVAQAPPPERKLEFEVASIRPAKEDGDHDSLTDHGFFRTHNLTLKRLIAIAYGVDNRLISGGPNWIDADSYDINAKIPEPFDQNRSPDTVPSMIQSLLADRFQLVIHREATEIPGYALVVVKKGAKVRAGDPAEKRSGISSKNAHLVATNFTMANFARNLARRSEIGRMVEDRTGLTGAFSFELDWAPEKAASNPDSTDDRPSIFAALTQQLGLKLESAKIPVQAIVIDRAEKPESN